MAWSLVMVLWMSGLRGEWPDWSEITERQQWVRQPLGKTNVWMQSTSSIESVCICSKHTLAATIFDTGCEQGAPQKMSSECMYLCIYVSIISTSAWEEDIAPLHFYCSLKQLWVGSTLGLVILTRLNNRSKIDVRWSGASETQTLKLTTCATCW